MEREHAETPLGDSIALALKDIDLHLVVESAKVINCSVVYLSL